jgi:hypothetical protein
VVFRHSVIPDLSGGKAPAKGDVSLDSGVVSLSFKPFSQGQARLSEFCIASAVSQGDRLNNQTAGSLQVPRRKSQVCGVAHYACTIFRKAQDEEVPHQRPNYGDGRQHHLGVSGILPGEVEGV